MVARGAAEDPRKPWSGGLALLADGTVLASGTRCSAPSPDAELFDPITGAWAGTQAMVVRILLGHTSTLLEDGSALVTGGEVPPSAPSAPYTYLKEAELYVPAPSPALRPRP